MSFPTLIFLILARLRVMDVSLLCSAMMWGLTHLDISDLGPPSCDG
jgi:hypothetical protein